MDLAYQATKGELLVDGCGTVLSLVSKAAEWREGTHDRVEVDASARSVDAVVHASETNGYQHH